MEDVMYCASDGQGANAAGESFASISLEHRRRKRIASNANTESHRNSAVTVSSPAESTTAIADERGSGGGLDLISFSIDMFCARNSISRTTYFSLRKAGCAPVEVRIGRLVRITREAELEWTLAHSSSNGGDHARS